MSSPGLIEIRDGVRILTRDGYREAIRRYFDDSRADLVASVKHLRRVHFENLALERFDASAPKYGPLDLDGRDWQREGLEEDVDGLAYRIFEKVARIGL